MPPYRTAPDIRVDPLDAEVARFARDTRRTRSLHGVAGFGALVVAATLSALPLVLPRRNELAWWLDPTPMDTLVPFHATTARRLPFFTLVRMQCWPMEDAERVRFEQDNHVECVDYWQPKPSSWR